MKDKFSMKADVYAKYRPAYPQNLFDFILSHVAGREMAWDCATGNGQSAKVLSRYFEKVFATDISHNQLQNGYQAKNIFYSVQPAEQTVLADHSIDLITVSQALHWFNFENFYREVRRVGKTGSRLAVWMYSLLRISPEIDRLVDEFHFQTLKDYWDSERKYVDSNYATIPFPFPETVTPPFYMEYNWSLDGLEGYLNTWSALQNFMKAQNYNPVPELIHLIRPYWKEETMKIRFPIVLRLGSVH